MTLSYEAWAVSRLTSHARCTVEESLSCIPLRNDPICRACFESDRGAENENSGRGAELRKRGARK